jgi:quercetin dioxygenase-like cupin family protein
MSEQAECRRWRDGAPTSAEIRAAVAAEGIPFYQWSSAPGDTYGAHRHPFAKIIYVLRGSIRFGLPESDSVIDLGAGDRLALPEGVLHDAIVGPDGVVCLEGRG